MTLTDTAPLAAQAACDPDWSYFTLRDLLAAAAREAGAAIGDDAAEIRTLIAECEYAVAHAINPQMLAYGQEPWINALFEAADAIPLRHWSLLLACAAQQQTRPRLPRPNLLG